MAKKHKKQKFAVGTSRFSTHSVLDSSMLPDDKKLLTVRKYGRSKFDACEQAVRCRGIVRFNDPALSITFHPLIMQRNGDRSISFLGSERVDEVWSWVEIIFRNPRRREELWVYLYPDASCPALLPISP